MTLNDLQRAALVLFAVREAGSGASVEQMKAICYCIRNRVKAGWFPDWITTLENADETAGNLPGPKAMVDVNSRAFQMLLRDVDDIYFAPTGRADDETPGADEETLESALAKSKYWLFLGPGRFVSPWFEENIIHDPENHPSHANMGVMMFFE